MMKIWPLILLFISISTHADSNFGMWGTTCDGDGFSININNKPNYLVVNDNQIVIKVHAKEIDSNKISLYYDSVADLGRGGMNFGWKNVSRIKPVAELSIIKKSGELRWKGFYDNKKSKYFWITEPDFVQSYSEGGVIKLHKCGI